MIKKIYNLTTNELMKLLVKRSTIIVLLLIFLSAIAIPLASNSFSGSNSNDEKSIYKGQLDLVSSEIKKIDITQSSGKVREAFLKSQKEQLNLILKYDIDKNGWRYQESNKYLSVLTQIDTINLLKENIEANVITENIPSGTNSGDVKEYVKLSRNEYDSTLAKLNTEKNNTYNSIKNNDYIGYYNSLIKASSGQLVALENQLSTVSEKVKKSPNNIDLQRQVDDVTNNIAILKKKIEIYKYRIDNKIPYESNNWKSATLIGIENLVSTIQTQILTKSEFIENGYGKTTYEEYVKEFESNQSKINNNIQANWYSLKNNIPQSQYQNNSARSATNGYIPAYSVIAILFMIIITGGIVSSEFSKETIKLVLIRPVSRFKVLLSKLIAVYIIGYGVLIISMVFITISNGISLGFSDYLVPVIKVSSGVVEVHNYFICLILQILFFGLSLLLFGALAFTLSTVTKNTAISVAVSILLFVGGPIISMILFTKQIMFVAKTPIPYLNIPSMGIIKKLAGGSGVLNNTLGGIELIILTLIFIIIAFTVFIKSDVKR